jgi:hypothetical protein
VGIESPTNEPLKPKRRGSDPEAPVAVYTTNNPNDADIIRTALLAEGIACHVNGAGQAGMPGATITRVTVDAPAADVDRARAFIGDAQTNSVPEGTSNRPWLRIAAGIILFIFAMPIALSLGHEKPSTIALISLGFVAAMATGYLLVKRKTAA